MHCAWIIIVGVVVSLFAHLSFVLTVELAFVLFLLFAVSAVMIFQKVVSPMRNKKRCLSLADLDAAVRIANQLEAVPVRQFVKDPMEASRFSMEIAVLVAQFEHQTGYLFPWHNVQKQSEGYKFFLGRRQQPEEEGVSE